MEMSRKKPAFQIHDSLRRYLVKYGREESIPIAYDDLVSWKEGIPVYDKNGEDTLWESVIYENDFQREIDRALVTVYALLKTDGDTSVIEHLKVNRIDYCHFGNSRPFRIQIVNKFNDNHDYFYIKRADASRVYGLEMEHILSPNRIEYIVDDDTLIEEHIAGIPGDIYIEDHLDQVSYNVGLAKEFVKFNERCFVMLLGDMRSYNYVIDVTPDFDKDQYRVRPIDFDQLAYEGRKNNYMPQYYKENSRVVTFCSEILTPETVNQYRHEERSLIKRRYLVASKRLNLLFDSMGKIELSTQEKRKNLIKELNEYHNTKKFNRLRSMGKVLKLHLFLMLDKPKPKRLPGKSQFKRGKVLNPVNMSEQSFDLKIKALRKG